MIGGQRALREPACGQHRFGGIAYVMASDAEGYLSAGGLVQLLGKWTVRFSDICLCYSRLRLSGMVSRAFVQSACLAFADPDADRLLRDVMPL